ncbi:MAG: DUF4397 domain-containing protein [Mucilaginibacter sp.]
MNTRFIILFLIILAGGLASCKNNDDVFKPVVSTYLNVVNTSADTLNFFVNGTRQLNGSSLSPGGQSDYLTVPAGTQNYQLKKNRTPDVLLSLPLNLTDSIPNTLYIAGGSADKTLVTTDIFTAVEGKVQLNFVQMSPDAGSLSVKVDDTLRFSAVPFKTAAKFLSVGSGEKEIKIFLTGSATPKIDTIVTLQPKEGYTIFVGGLLNGTGSSKFSFGLVPNF